MGYVKFLMGDQGEVGLIDNPLGILYLSEYQQHISA
jgi:hypothetical protein